jgi:hypothetical protein
MKHGLLLAAIAIAGMAGFLAGRLTKSALPVSQAQGIPTRGTECTTALLSGDYAFDLSGTIVSISSSTLQPGPYATVGLLSLDGRGGLNLVTTQSYNGAIVPPTRTAGAYTLAGDCTGRMTLATGAAYVMVAADGGREIRFLQINNNSVLRGVARRI